MLLTIACSAERLAPAATLSCSRASWPPAAAPAAPRASRPRNSSCSYSVCLVSAMTKSCAGCSASLSGWGARQATCAVCSQHFCAGCCYHYLSLADAPTQQVLACNDCFLKSVNWDASRTYDVLGPEGGEPVVLVHGALIGRQCLAGEAAALAEAGYRVIVPDLPAHGARFKETPLTLDNAVATLAHVIAAEAPGRRVLLMGFSMGGYVAAAFAAAHPELLSGVVLGACAHDTRTVMWQLIGRMAEGVYAMCSPKTKSGFIYKSYPDIMDPARPVIQEAFLRAGAEMDAWRYTWRVMYDANMHALLPKVTCPALLAVGEKDFRSHEQVWASYLVKGRLLVLKGGVHSFMVQPGIVDEWRQHARSFAAAAEWGKVGSPRPEAAAPAAEPRMAEAPDAAVAGAEAAAAAAQPRKLRLGELFRNLWAQRK